MTGASVFRAPRWSGQAGVLARSIGTPLFHEELMKLLGLTVPTDSFWIIRYAGQASPDVVFTHRVSKRVRQAYCEQCAVVDPFSARWSVDKQAGVFALSAIRPASEEDARYSDTFRAVANIEDEVGILLPVTAQSCLAIFLERRRGLFTEDELALLRTLYPMVEQFCRAHLGWLFSDIKADRAGPAGGLASRPTLVVDPSGSQVHASAAWEEVLRRRPELKARLPAIIEAGGGDHELGDVIIRAERMGPDFPLAPNGLLCVLEQLAHVRGGEDADAIEKTLALFTQRERDVLRLALDGRGNADISRALGVGAGSIRNVKTRLYRKAGVSSEGELVMKLLHLAKHL